MNPNAWLDLISPRLNDTWRGSWKSGTIEPGRYLHDHELVVVTEGSCRVQVERDYHELAIGTFLIIPPGIYHTTMTHHGGVGRSCFHFDWLRPAPTRRRLPSWIFHPARPRSGDIKRGPAFVPRRVRQGHFDPSGPILPLMERIFQRQATGSEQERATCHLLFAEVLYLLLWREGTRRPPGDRSTLLAYAVKELLDRTPENEMGIQALLATLGFSYAHLCRLFQAKFGISPVEYRNSARLERAADILRDPRRTIAEAAYTAGFNDPAYFSRMFRKRHGVSPSRARREGDALHRCNRRLF
ncbi:MAG: AraC family transcriptional regulator [Methylacidiphilales bacterium]|nr:AraC family transcriptional regulator [Candidatus Methylacidiphilales bacterium]